MSDDKARKELALLIAHPRMAAMLGSRLRPTKCTACEKSLPIADAILEAGYRKVTEVMGEEVETLAQEWICIPVPLDPETVERAERAYVEEYQAAIRRAPSNRKGQGVSADDVKVANKSAMRAALNAVRGEPQ